MAGFANPFGSMGTQGLVGGQQGGGGLYQALLQRMQGDPRFQQQMALPGELQMKPGMEMSPNGDMGTMMQSGSVGKYGQPAQGQYGVVPGQYGQMRRHGMFGWF